MQDLIRGIKKIIGEEKVVASIVQNVTISHAGNDIEPLLKHVYMFLEDKKWESADEYCERILDMDPECAKAYLGKMLSELKVSCKENLKD